MWRQAFRKATVQATFKLPNATTRPGTRVFEASKRPFFQQRFIQYQRFNGGGNKYQRFQQGTNAFRAWSSSPTFYYQVAGLGGVTGGIYIYNLETVPISGRRRFNIISDEKEREMAQGQGNMVLQQYRHKILPPTDRRVQLVQKVIRRLMPFSGASDGNWRVFVIDEDETNAFVTPDNTVFVFSGILPICKSEDGLAAVLGHEIAHNVAHHTAEKMSWSYAMLAPVLLIDVFFGLGMISQWFLNFTLALPNGRAQESEADYIGLLMMAQACYNPEEAVQLWARMEKAEKISPPEFMSTHPSSHNRQSKLREWLSEAQMKSEESGCRSTMAYADSFNRFQQNFRP